MNKQEIEPHIVQSFGHAYRTSRERVEDIAKRHHVHRKTIYKYAKLHGWVRPTLEARTTNHIEPRVIPFREFHKAYFDDCLNTDDLQKRFKCSHRVIKRTLDHHGIERMRRNERIQMKRHFEQVKGGR